MRLAETMGVPRAPHERHGHLMNGFFSSAQRVDQVAQPVEIHQVAEAVEALVKTLIERLAGRGARVGECVKEPAKVLARASDRESEIVQSLNLHR